MSRKNKPAVIERCSEHRAEDRKVYAPNTQVQSAPRISPENLMSYLKTRYLVDSESPPSIVLRIGRRSEALSELYARRGVDESIFVTAFNPFSRQQTPSENRRANDELRVWLETEGFTFFLGRGVDENGAWPSEESYLVLGASTDLGRALCVRFEQNAVVHAGADAIPTLLLHPGAVIG